MFVIRPISQYDSEVFIEMAYAASIGITSMPRNPQLLQERITASEHAFAKQILQPENEKYIFVLEDLATGKIEGTCGIIAKEKHDIPLYFYRMDEINQPGMYHLSTVTSQGAYHLALPQKIPVLRVVHYFDTPSEICSLYLSPESRGGGNGRLLSLSRFLFIAAFPQRFDNMICANLRGYINEKNVSYFWNGIGRNFLDMEFEMLMNLRDEDAIDVALALPTYPIYKNLLPKEVQDSIGKIHPETRPALNMLMQEGFQLTEELDVFDGGPMIEAETQEIRTIKFSIVDRIAEILTEPFEGSRYIISNNRLNFRACFGLIQHRGHQGICISSETAEALQVHAGDLIRYITPQGETRGAGL